jgi:lipopolysaccharide export system protein LptA
MIKKIAVFLTILIIFLGLYFNFIYKNNDEELIVLEDDNYNTNLLENIKYVAKDDDGNEYIINAAEGEIDLNNSDIIFLKNVKSQVKLKNSFVVNITSNFGKYNASNYDTIFSKNVRITYLNNEITGEYLDLSLIENRIIVSKNIIFTNEENVLKADVIEIDIKTKDAKIFMYEESKQVNIKNKDYPDGNN